MWKLIIIILGMAIILGFNYTIDKYDKSKEYYDLDGK